MINNCVVTDYITPEEYLDMRQSVEWSVFPIGQATEGIKNTTHICLMAVKGKEEFYKKFGFVERPNENFGCGMHQWIEG